VIDILLMKDSAKDRKNYRELSTKLGPMQHVSIAKDFPDLR